MSKKAVEQLVVEALVKALEPKPKKEVVMKKLAKGAPAPVVDKDRELVENIKTTLLDTTNPNRGIEVKGALRLLGKPELLEEIVDSLRLEAHEKNERDHEKNLKAVTLTLKEAVAAAKADAKASEEAEVTDYERRKVIISGFTYGLGAQVIDLHQVKEDKATKVIAGAIDTRAITDALNGNGIKNITTGELVEQYQDRKEVGRGEKFDPKVRYTREERLSHKRNQLNAAAARAKTAEEARLLNEADAASKKYLV